MDREARRFQLLDENGILFGLDFFGQVPFLDTGIAAHLTELLFLFALSLSQYFLFPFQSIQSDVGYHMFSLP